MKTKKKKKSEHAPGLHVLSKEDSKRVMRKVWQSRKKSEAIARKKKADEIAKKTNAFSKFVNDVKKLQNEWRYCQEKTAICLRPFDDGKIWRQKL